MTPTRTNKASPNRTGISGTDRKQTGLFKRLETLLLVLAFAAGTFLIGCDIGSVDSVSAVLSNDDGTIYDFSGLYMNPNNSTSTTGILPIVFPNTGNQVPTGELIRSLRLLQYGAVLEGYDSAGLTWYGSISSLQGTTATFSLSGRTTVGNSVEMTGTLNYNDSTSTLNATWIEPTYYGSIIATATVSPATTNSPDPDAVSVSPTTASLNTNDVTQVFNADGGTGSYTWSGGSGSFSSTTGSSVTYTHDHSIGSFTITVEDSDGDAGTATVTYSGPEALYIDPGSYLIVPGTTTPPLPFEAVGGTGPYSWEVSDSSLGTLSSTTGTTVEYTFNETSGENTITVTDSLSATATATATYP